MLLITLSANLFTVPERSLTTTFSFSRCERHCTEEDENHSKPNKGNAEEIFSAEYWKVRFPASRISGNVNEQHEA
ncbi:LY6/PLAUR domain containing 6B [Homo sapiens]|uniref:LY6/PLAUR domain containing 6B n=1 Tax=Homo sapiens TaxID=9606 RepID=F8WCH4_HUMAN|nr:LY6/PLAUR domain containing 6B [Homo sapiens]KAI4036433.1 LY6/PLAUR domain containing 6B [Homo sapiens]